jgi:hypothetical protein
MMQTITLQIVSLCGSDISHLGRLERRATLIQVRHPTFTNRIDVKQFELIFCIFKKEDSWIVTQRSAASILRLFSVH